MDAHTARGGRAATGGTRRAVLLAIVLAFVTGAVIAGWLVHRFAGTEGLDSELARVMGDPVSAPPTPATPAVRQAAPLPAAAPATVAAGGALESRLAAAEARLARLDLQAAAVSGNTARAEGLLIAFAARRALEKGAPLGYLGPQLELRFGDAQPQAVATILAAARQPITVDRLIARLDGLSPRLADNANSPLVDRIGDELSQLFVIRRESAPSPQPRKRIERARLFLESGRVDAAIAEVANLPGASQAAAWIADARRYADAQRALDRIETTAVLEPRMLRGGDGTAVEQASPLAAG